jgi:hypothetical protein
VVILRDLIGKSDYTAPPGEEPKTELTFTCCGRQCTTVDEVPKILKPRRAFNVEINRAQNTASLRLHPVLTSYFHWGTGATDEQRASAHRQLKPIFDRRKRHITTFARSIPYGTLTIAVFVAIPLAELFAHSIQPRVGSTLAQVPALLVLAMYLLPTVPQLIPLSPIIHRNSYDPSPLRKLLTEKNVPLLIAGIIGIAGTLLTQFLIHRLWPKP